MIESSRRVHPWRQSVAAAARGARCPLRSGNVLVSMRMRFVRPRGHYTTKGAIRASAPARPGYADCDKLARAVCDALTGIAYHDDRQVVALSIERRWAEQGEGNGATITIADAPNDGVWSYESLPPA